MDVNMYHFFRKKLFSIFLLLLVIAVFYPSPAYALNIAARIGDQYTEVQGGDRLYFEVDIKYPENPRRKDLRIEYQIIEPASPAGGNGEIIASEKVLRAVETQASFLDYIVVPKSAKGGIHDLNVIITDYENLHEEVSATFKILKGIDQVTTYFFIMLGAILLVAVLVIIQILSGRRKGGI